MLGRHPLAAAALEDLVAWGVAADDAEPDRGDPPPVSAVRVVDGTGERSVSSVNDLGASPATSSPPSSGDVLVLDGWYRGLALPAAHAARERGTPVLLGAGSWRPLVAELLPLADYVIVPASFPLEQLPDEMVSAHTNGAGDILWRTPDGTGSISPPHVVARDTLAAGDVFLGTAAFEIARGNRDWPSVLEHSAGVAARFVAQLGRAGLPRRGVG